MCFSGGRSINTPKEGVDTGYLLAFGPRTGGVTRINLAPAKPQDILPPHERRDPSADGHRAGRPRRRRATPPTGLRRTPQAGGPEHGPRGAGPNAPGDRPGA